MTIIFKIADDQGLLPLDLKDLRSMVQYVGDNAAQFKTAYGNVSAQSVGAIQRALRAWKNRAEMCFSASRHWTSGTGWQWQMTDAVISIFCIA